MDSHNILFSGSNFSFLREDINNSTVSAVHSSGYIVVYFCALRFNSVDKTSFWAVASRMETKDGMLLQVSMHVQVVHLSASVRKATDLHRCNKNSK